MFDPIEARIAANMVEDEVVETLKKNGQVGYSETSRGNQVFEYNPQIAALYPFEYNPEKGAWFCEIGDVGEVSFTSGQLFEVVIDGKVYRCEMYDDGYGGLMLGDDSGSFKDYPFLIAIFSGDAMICAIQGIEAPQHIAIYEVTETIHPIDPKFLPLDVIGFPVTMLNIVECGLPSLTVLIGRAIQNDGTFEAEYDVHGLWETVLGWSIGTATEGKISPLWFTDGQNTMMVTGFGQKSINAIGCYYASGLLQIGCVLRTESMSASDKCTVSVFAKAV